jgi:hypothetical protein|uniref:Uncharacterized protein n=1 Tax=Picea glauca TaxID=3330 RepID=A0A101M5K8_PICGL|nr:hypothetical protein ABT39_MTgene1191 [Picea glauca]
MNRLEKELRVLCKMIFHFIHGVDQYYEALPIIYISALSLAFLITLIAP